jgi:7-keto-8-aminopelargonate synthetase-like enzyme
MAWFAEAVARRNAEITRQGRWRQVRTLAGGGPVTRCVADGRAVVQFASNDYLGLATHPALADAAADAAREMGTGAGASRLIVGSREVHDELELALAAHWAPLVGPQASALLFPTGFAANLGAMATVVAAGGQADTVVLSDELNHASIIDGIRLSRAEVEVFPHADLDALDRRLSLRRRPRAVVVSDMVFSMDGDVADAVGLARCCAAHDAVLVLDVAHDAFSSLLALAEPVVETGTTVVVVGTSSKTLGALGGWLVADRATVELALNTARSFIFTTAPSPPDAAAARVGLRLLEGHEGERLRARLRTNVDRLAPGHPSPIIPLMLGAEQRALAVSAALLEDGLLVPAIRPPTVAEGSCRLRIALSAEHTSEQLDRLEDALARAGAPLPGLR